jgi:hypothetical protein
MLTTGATIFIHGHGWGIPPEIFSTRGKMVIITRQNVNDVGE